MMTPVHRFPERCGIPWREGPSGWARRRVGGRPGPGYSGACPQVSTSASRSLPLPSVATAGGASGCPWAFRWAIKAAATSPSSFPIARPTRRRVSMSMTVPRRKVPRSSCSGCPLFPFVTRIRPQGIQLRTRQVVMGQQGGFDRFPMPGGLYQPVQNRLFLDPFDAVNGHQTVAFG